MRFKVSKNIYQPVRIGYFRKLIKKREEEQMIFPPFLGGGGHTNFYLYNLSCYKQALILNRRQFLKEKARDIEKARVVFINSKHLVSNLFQDMLI